MPYTQEELSQLFGTDPTEEQNVSRVNQQRLGHLEGFDTQAPSQNVNFSTAVGEDANEVLAYNQSNWAQLGNGLIKATGTFAGSLTENLGWVVSAPTQMIYNAVDDNPETGVSNALYNDWLGKGVDKWNEALREQFPNYYTKAQQEASVWENMTTTGAANFWGDKALNGLGYMLGAVYTPWGMEKALTTMGVKNAIKRLGKEALQEGTEAALKQSVKGLASAEVARTAKIAGMGVMMGAAESRVEARQTFDESLKMLHEKRDAGDPAYQQSDEELFNLAESIGNASFAGNLAVTSLSNMFLFGKFIPGYSNLRKSLPSLYSTATRKGVGEIAVKELGMGMKALKTGTNIAEGVLLEGGQELAQTTMQHQIPDYYTKKYDANSNANWLGALQQSAGEAMKTLGTKEGMESAILGALLGGGSNLVTNRGAGAKAKADAQILKDTLPQVLKGLKRQVELKVTAAKSAEGAEVALKKGDEFTFHNEINDELKAKIQAVKEAGGIEFLLEDLEELKTLSPEEVRSVLDISKDSVFNEQDKVSKIEKIITEVKQLDKTYNQVAAKYPELLNKENKTLFDAIYDVATGLQNVANREVVLTEEITKAIPEFNYLKYRETLPEKDKEGNALEYKKEYKKTVNSWMDYIKLNDPMLYDELKTKLEDLDKLAERRDKYTKQFDKAIKEPEKIEAEVAAAKDKAIPAGPNIFTKDESIADPRYNELADNLEIIQEDDETLSSIERLQDLTKKLEAALKVEKTLLKEYEDAEDGSAYKEALGKLLREKTVTKLKDSLTLKIQALEKVAATNKTSGIQVLFDDFDVIGNLLWRKPTKEGKYEYVGEHAADEHITEEGLLKVSQITWKDLPKLTRLRKVTHVSKENKDTTPVYNHKTQQPDERVQVKNGIEALQEGDKKFSILVEVEVNKGEWVPMGYLRDPNRFRFGKNEFNPENMDHLNMLNPAFVEVIKGIPTPTNLGIDYINQFTSLKKAFDKVTETLKTEPTVDIDKTDFLQTVRTYLLDFAQVNIQEYLNLNKNNFTTELNGFKLGPVLLRREKGNVKKILHFNYETNSFEEVPEALKLEVIKKVIDPNVLTLNALGNNYVGIVVPDAKIKGSKVLAVQFTKLTGVPIDGNIVTSGMVKLVESEAQEKKKETEKTEDEKLDEKIPGYASLYNIFIATVFKKGINLKFKTFQVKKDEVKLSLSVEVDGVKNYIQINAPQAFIDSTSKFYKTTKLYIKDGAIYKLYVHNQTFSDAIKGLKESDKITTDEALRKVINEIIADDIAYQSKQETGRWNGVIKSLLDESGKPLQISSFQQVPDFTADAISASFPKSIVVGLHFDGKDKEAYIAKKAAKEKAKEEKAEDNEEEGMSPAMVKFRIKGLLNKLRSKTLEKEEVEAFIAAIPKNHKSKEYDEFLEKIKNQFSEVVVTKPVEPVVSTEPITPVPTEPAVKEDKADKLERELKEKQEAKKNNAPEDDEAAPFKLSDEPGISRDIADAIKNLKGILPIKTADNPTGTITVEEFATVMNNLSGKNFTIGKFKDAVIFLAKNRIKGVEYHEAFHAIFRTFLSKSEVAKAYEAAEKRYGEPGISVLNEFKKEHINRRNLSNNDLTLLWYEEKMADEFMDQMNEGFIGGIFSKIKRLLKSFTKLFQQSPDYIDVLFDKIRSGFYKTANPTTDILYFPGEAFKLLKDGQNQLLDYNVSEAIINRVVSKAFELQLSKGTLLDEDYNAAIEQVKEFYLPKGTIMLAIRNRLKSVSESHEDTLIAQLVRIKQALEDSSNLSIIKEQVKNQLALLKYTTDDMNDPNEAGLSTKEATELGGYENLTQSARNYLATVAMPYLTELGITLTEEEKRLGVFNTYVDSYNLHNVLDRSMVNTLRQNFISRLGFLAEQNETIAAFQVKLLNDIKKEIGEDVTVTTPIETLGKSHTFNIIYAAYNKAAIQMVHTDVDPQSNQYGVYKANQNDVQQVQLNNWKANWFNNDLPVDVAKEYIKRISESFLNYEMYFSSKTNKDILLSSIQEDFQALGMELSRAFLEYSFESRIVNNNWKENSELIQKFPLAEGTTLVEKEWAMSQAVKRSSIFQDVEGISADDLFYIAEAIESSKIYTKDKANDAETPEGDLDVYGRLKRMAEGNAVFDDTVEPVMQRDAEGNPVYSHVYHSYLTYQMLLWKQQDRMYAMHNDSEQEMREALKDSMETSGDKMEDWEFERFFQTIKYNHILRGKNNQGIDPLRFTELVIKNWKTIINSGQRRQEVEKRGFTQGEGTKYAQLDMRAVLANMLIYFAETEEGADKHNTLVTKLYVKHGLDRKENAEHIKVAPVVATQKELKSTQDAIQMPVMNLGNETGINDFGKEILGDYLKQEIESIKIVRDEIEALAQGKDVAAITQIHDGEKRGLKLFNFKKLHNIAETKDFAEKIERFEDVTEAEIKEAVGHFTRVLYNEFVGTLKQEQLIQENEKKQGEEVVTETSGKLIPNYYLESGNTLNEGRIAHFFYNTLINNLGYQNLMFGNSSIQFVNAMDFFTRIAGAAGSGPVNGKGYTTLYVGEDEGTVGAFSKTGDKPIKHTDGQSLGTIEWLYKQIDSLGKVNSRVKKLYEEKLLMAEELNPAEIMFLFKNDALAGVKKTQIYNTATYAKTATETLLRPTVSMMVDMFQGKKVSAKQVRFTLDYLYLLKKDGITVIPDTVPEKINNYLLNKYGEKFFDDTEFLLSDKEGVIESVHDLWKAIPGYEKKHDKLNFMESGGIELFAYPSAIKTSIVKGRVIRVSDLWVKEQVVNDGIKDEIVDPVQLVQLIFGEQSDKKVMFHGREISYKDLGLVMYNNLLGKRQEQTIKRAVKYISRNGQKYNKLLVKKIHDAVESMGGGYYLKELTKANDSKTDFAYNINRPTILQRMENMFLSTFGDMTLRNTVQGTSFTIVSPEGYEVIRDEKGNVIPKNILKTYSSKQIAALGKSDRLRYKQDENGNWYGEVIISNPIAIGLNLKAGDTIKDGNIMKMISTRIPGQDKSSMAYLKVVDIFPGETGNNIAFAAEIYELAGTDNDMDKQYAKHVPYYISNGDLKYFGDYYNQVSEDAEYLKENIKQLQELIYSLTPVKLEGEEVIDKLSKEDKKKLLAYKQALANFKKELSELDEFEAIYEKAYEEYLEEALHNDRGVKDQIKWSLENNERYQKLKFDLSELRLKRKIGFKIIDKYDINEEGFSGIFDTKLPTVEKLADAKRPQLLAWAKYVGLLNIRSKKNDELRDQLFDYVNTLTEREFELANIAAESKDEYKRIKKELLEIYTAVELEALGGIHGNPITKLHSGFGYAQSKIEFIAEFGSTIKANVKNYRSGNFEAINPITVSETEALFREVEEFLIMNEGNKDIATTPTDRSHFEALKTKLYDVFKLKDPAKGIETTFSPTDIARAKKIATTSAENIGIGAMFNTSFQHLVAGGSKIYGDRTKGKDPYMNNGERINYLVSQIVSAFVDAKKHQDPEHFNLSAITVPTVMSIIQEGALDMNRTLLMFIQPKMVELTRALAIKRSEFSTEEERSEKTSDIIDGYLANLKGDDKFIPTEDQMIKTLVQHQNQEKLSTEDQEEFDKVQYFVIKLFKDQTDKVKFRSAFNSLTTLLKGPKSTWGEMQKITQDMKILGIEVVQKAKTTGESVDDYVIRHTKFAKQFPDKYVDDTLKIVNKSPLIQSLLKSYVLLQKQHGSKFFLSQTNFVQEFLERNSHVWKNYWVDSAKGQEMLNKKLVLYLQATALRHYIGEKGTFSLDQFVTDSKEETTELVKLLEKVRTTNEGHKKNRFLRFLSIDKPFEFTLGTLAGKWFHGISVNNRIKKNPVVQSKLMTAALELFKGNDVATKEENTEAAQLMGELIKYIIGKDGGAFKGTSFAPYIFPSLTPSIDKALNAAQSALAEDTNAAINEVFGLTKTELMEEALEYLARDLQNKFNVSGSSSGYLGGRGKQTIVKAIQTYEEVDKDEALKLYEAMREDDLEIDNVNESPVKFDRTKIVLNLWANYNKAELKGPERSAILRANRSFMASSGFMTEVPIAGETYYGLRPKEYVTINYYDKNSKTSTMVIYRLVDSTIDDRNKALDSRDVIVTQAEYVATEFIGHGQLEASSFYLSDHDAVTVKKEVTKEQENPNYYKGDIKPEPNTIFVFGSNPIGVNGRLAADEKNDSGGAAAVAQRHFGVEAKEIMDNTLSKNGKAYGLVTVTGPGKPLSKTPAEITKNIKKLYEVAKQNPNKLFKIAYRHTTKKSLNGYTGLQMIEMFNDAGERPKNVIFSKEWFDTLEVIEQPAPKVETPIVIKKKEIVTQEIPTLDEKDTAKVFTLLNVLNAPIRKDASNIKFEYISTKIGETKSILYRYSQGNLHPYKVVGTIGESGLVTLQRDVETKDKKALERDLKLIPTKLTSLEGIEIEDERLFDSIEKIEDKKEKKQAVENYNKLKELLCQ